MLYFCCFRKLAPALILTLRKEDSIIFVNKYCGDCGNETPHDFGESKAATFHDTAYRSSLLEEDQALFLCFRNPASAFLGIEERHLRRKEGPPLLLCFKCQESRQKRGFKAAYYHNISPLELAPLPNLPDITVFPFFDFNEHEICQFQNFYRNRQNLAANQLVAMHIKHLIILASRSPADDRFNIKYLPFVEKLKVVPRAVEISFFTPKKSLGRSHHGQTENFGEFLNQSLMYNFMRYKRSSRALKQEYSTDAERNYFDYIRFNGESLLSLISNHFDFAKMKTAIDGVDDDKENLRIKYGGNITAALETILSPTLNPALLRYLLFRLIQKGYMSLMTGVSQAISQGLGSGFEERFGKQFGMEIISLNDSNIACILHLKQFSMSSEKCVDFAIFFKVSIANAPFDAFYRETTSRETDFKFCLLTHQCTPIEQQQIISALCEIIPIEALYIKNPA